MKNPFLPYTPFEVDRLQQMKRYVDAFHIAFDNKDLPAYQSAIADLAELYATTFADQKRGEQWKGTAQLVRRSDNLDYLGQTAGRLEGIVEAYSRQLSISFANKMCGYDTDPDFLAIFNGKD